jgi:serine/threonine protein kinase
MCPFLDPQARQREEFMAEMRILARLRHPCITTLMGAVITSRQNPMIVMEYMEYGSLYDLLRNETMFLSGEIILQITRDLAQGLRFLHSSKPMILHGDLKARNILIDARFRAKICDFGLSLKKSRSITGTPYWLAPEYLRGECSYSQPCDIYSVGVILFEIYARKNPYEGEPFQETLRKVCNRRINKRPGVPNTAPAKVVDLMKRCWHKDPAFRPDARVVDAAFMDMNTQDVEQVTEEQLSIQRKERATGDMLYEIFPKHIADALQQGQKVEPESHELVTIVFSDIVRFTDISREISPLKVSEMLDRLYLAFDKVSMKTSHFL